METVVAIIAFAVCALAFEANVTKKVEDGPVSDQEFAAAVEWEKQVPVFLHLDSENNSERK